MGGGIDLISVITKLHQPLQKKFGCVRIADLFKQVDIFLAFYRVPSTR